MASSSNCHMSLASASLDFMSALSGTSDDEEPVHVRSRCVCVSVCVCIRVCACTCAQWLRILSTNLSPCAAGANVCVCCVRACLCAPRACAWFDACVRV